MWSYTERLDKVRKFIASVVRYNGSAGSSQDALNNLQEIEDYIEELLATEEPDFFADLDDTDEKESEEMKVLIDRIERLEEENGLLAEELAEYEMCNKKVENEPFPKVEVPEDVWCSHCYGVGHIRNLGTCPICGGVGRRLRE